MTFRPYGFNPWRCLVLLALVLFWLGLGMLCGVGDCDAQWGVTSCYSIDESQQLCFIVNPDYICDEDEGDECPEGWANQVLVFNLEGTEVFVDCLSQDATICVDHPGAGTYRIQFIPWDGSPLCADDILLAGPNPVEMATWGAMKALYQ
jgi:hypothetical protein